MTRHAFVDESKRGGTLLVAVTLADPCDVAKAHRDVKALLLPRQRRLHFKTESDRRRKEILGVIGGLPIEAGLYSAPDWRRDVDARRAVFDQMVPDLLDRGVTRLVIERDESLIVHDQRALYAVTARLDCRGTFNYSLVLPHIDPMLWVSDAIAWCVTKGGQWRTAVEPLIGWRTDV